MIYQFPKDLLPKNFSYPADYLEFAENHDPDEFEPWNLLHIPNAALELRASLSRKFLYGRDMVPFAVFGFQPDTGCFFPDPAYPRYKVTTIDPECDEGFEKLNEFASFSEWLDWNISEYGAVRAK